MRQYPLTQEEEALAVDLGFPNELAFKQGVAAFKKQKEEFDYPPSLTKEAEQMEFRRGWNHAYHKAMYRQWSIERSLQAKRAA